MDITKTINLLQSQIPGKPEYNLSVSQTNPAREKNQAADAEFNTENTDTISGNQQSTGEEFSTFLTLLTAQIKNQDPLAPLDSTQFVEQLATFSNLELQAKGNQSLDLIAALLARQIEILTPADSTAPDS